MRKLCAWLLTLALLLGLLPLAMAQEDENAAVLPLTVITAQGAEDVGSAFLLHDGETAVTAYHLLSGVQEARVGGAEIVGLLGWDEESDVALVRLAISADAQPLRLSAAQPAKGDTVVRATASGQDTVTVTALTHAGTTSALRFPEDGSGMGGALLKDGEVVGLICGLWNEEEGSGVAADAASIGQVFDAAVAANFAVTPLTAQAEDGSSLGQWDDLPAAGQDASPDLDPNSSAPESSISGLWDDLPAQSPENPNISSLWEDFFQHGPALPPETTEGPKATEAPETTEVPESTRVPGSILDDLIGSTSQKDGDAKTTWLEGFTVRITAANKVTLDWSACAVADLAADSVFGVFYSGLEDPYQMYFETEQRETSAELTLIPGRAYLVTIQHAHGAIDPSLELDAADMDRCTALFLMPTAGTFSRYGCVNSGFSIGQAAAGTAVVQGETLPEVTLDAAILADEDIDLYYQCTSVYSVKHDQTAALCLVLTAPDGSCYTADGTFTFEAGSTQDVWMMPLQDIRTLYSRYHTAWESGDYVLTLYFDSEIAAQQGFSLK